MSVLKVAKLQGISQTNFEITVPSGHKLIINGTLKTSSIQSSAGTNIWSPDSSGNISISTNITSTAAISGSRITATTQLNLATWTTATRPTTNLVNGVLGFNTDSGKGIEVYYNGSWISLAEVPGTSSTNPATSAAAIYTANPSATNGLYWISTPNGGTRQVYCDFTTPDENNNRGWMLVASFGTGSQWRDTWPTTSNVIQTVNSNSWSSNFGDFSINKFRVTATNSLSNLGTSSSGGDWYYHWNTNIPWKSVWAWTSGSNRNWINDTSGDNSGNINAFGGWPPPTNAGNSVSRCCMRGFDWAYNIKHSYKASTQRWNNFSDSSGGGTGQNIPDYWGGLTSSGGSLNYSFASDGTLGIIPQGDSSTTCAHDCNNNNTKVGQDDAGVCYYYGSSATSNLGANVGNTGTDYPVLFWIK